MGGGGGELNIMARNWTVTPFSCNVSCNTMKEFYDGEHKAVGKEAISKHINIERMLF